MARKHNMVLLTPEAPGPDCDDSDNCWYDVKHAPGKARWSSDLMSHVKAQYAIDLDRVVIGGYSSGAQWTTRFFLPAHGEAHSVDLAVAIAYGGAPVATSRFSSAYAKSTAVSFDTGKAGIEAYSARRWGARGGYSWYTNAGFTTDATWPSAETHYRWGQFQRILDREITRHLRPKQGTPPPQPVLAADDGGFGGSGSTYHLADDYSGRAAYIFPYRNDTSRSYVGDLGRRRPRHPHRAPRTDVLREERHRGRGSRRRRLRSRARHHAGGRLEW